MSRLRARPGRAGRSDRGSATVELVILAPVLGLFLALLVAGGRVAVAHQAVQASAAEAARSASIARTQAQAGTEARAGAATSLRNQDTTCRHTTVTLDTTGFAIPVGSPASVGATVTCQVELAGLLPGLPGSLAITATARSPLDTYRER